MPIGAVAAGISAIGAIGGAVVSGNAASDAAKTQANAAKKGLATQQKMFDVSQANLKPYMDIGTQVLPTLSAMINGGGNSAAMMENLKNYPGYQFALGEGQKGLDANLSKMGSRVSGNAIQAGINYNQNAASTLFDNYFNHLKDLTGIGGNAAAMSATNAINAGNSQAGTIMAQGEATAAGQAAQGNIWGGLLSNTLPAIAGQAAGAYTSSAPSGAGNSASNYNGAIFNPVTGKR